MVPVGIPEALRSDPRGHPRGRSAETGACEQAWASGREPAEFRSPVPYAKMSWKTRKSRQFQAPKSTKGRLLGGRCVAAAKTASKAARSKTCFICEDSGFEDV